MDAASNLRANTSVTVVRIEHSQGGFFGAHFVSLSVDGSIRFSIS
jgi:hypothetical protein